MSDRFLRYVPVDPRFQPTHDAALKAAMLLRTLMPRAEKIHSVFKGHVEFVDAGSNWSGVHCPACHADASDWWNQAMEEAWESKFESLDVIAQCCGAKVSLNELEYPWPVAFGSFVLEAVNPGIKNLLQPELEMIGALIGCPVREIRAHV